MNMLGPTPEVPVCKQRDSTGVVILNNRCRVRLNETQLSGKFETKFYFLCARGHADELSLTPGENEDRNKIRFHARAAARRLVVGPAGIGKTKELAALKRGFDVLRTPCELEMLDTLEVTKDLFGIAIVLSLVIYPVS
jgi:hypothetical protein